MNVSVVIVTRGDVDIGEILEGPWPEPCKEIVVWDNSKRQDLGVYGRYAAIEECSGDLIFVQDDDVLLPHESVGAIVNEWLACESLPDDHRGHPHASHIVSNMPREFRHSFYSDHCLVGFGACFHRDAPNKAFDRFLEGRPFWPNERGYGIDKFFYWRTCDVVFTTLTPYVMVDVPKENLPWATNEDRMYRQMDHYAERTQMLELARRVRDQ